MNSNPGIINGDSIIIADEETRTPCCVAMASNIRSFKVDEESRMYIYLKDCGTLNENTMNVITKIIRSITSIVKIVNANQNLCR